MQRADPDGCFAVTVLDETGAGKMAYRQERLLEGMLQRAADSLWAGLPGRLKVCLEDGQIRSSYEAWSAALFRHEVAGEVGLSEARKRLRWVNGEALGDDTATRIIHSLLGAATAYQHARHATARTLGLVTEGEHRDFPSDLLNIDRSLSLLADEAGVGIREAVRAVLAPDGRAMLDHDRDEIMANHLGLEFFVQHQAGRPPIVSSWISVGTGEFNGNFLEVPDILPESILAAAPGRRLGEFISTGWGHLDSRLIEAATRFDKDRQIGGWHRKSNAEFRLRPDLVPLGATPRFADER